MRRGTIIIPILQTRKSRPGEVCNSSSLGFEPKQSDSKAETLIALLAFTVPTLLCSGANPQARTLSFSRGWTLESRSLSPCPRAQTPHKHYVVSATLFLID